MPEVEASDFLNEIMKLFPESGVEIFHGDVIYLLKESDETVRHFKRESIVEKPVTFDEIPYPWYKIILAWNPGELKSIEEYMIENNIFSRYKNLRYTYSEPQFIEILNKNCSKGNALNELVKMLGIDPENVIAIGDNLNDIELLNEAGIGVAVENAHPELIKNADYVSCKNDNHAVSKIINELLIS